MDLKECIRMKLAECGLLRVRCSAVLRAIIFILGARSDPEDYDILE